MWKSTEADDDVSVLLGVAQRSTGELTFAAGRVVAQRHEQSDARVLVYQVFGMFEGHVEKAAFIEPEIKIRARFDAVAGNRERQVVRTERLPITPENVSRQLIAGQNVGEPATRSLQPVGKLIGMSRLDQVAELVAQRIIECGSTIEPALPMSIIGKLASQVAKPKVEQWVEDCHRIAPATNPSTPCRWRISAVRRSFSRWLRDFETRAPLYGSCGGRGSTCVPLLVLRPRRAGSVWREGPLRCLGRSQEWHG